MYIILKKTINFASLSLFNKGVKKLRTEQTSIRTTAMVANYLRPEQRCVWCVLLMEI